MRQAAGVPALPRAEAAAVQPRAAEGAEAPLRAGAAVASAARLAGPVDGPPWSAAVSVASSDRC